VFKGLGNLASLIKQARDMSGKMRELADTLKTKRAEGSAGGGLVKVEVNGLGEVLACRIDPTLAGDREMIEDLLPAAVNQAQSKAKELHAEAMRSLAQDAEMPALDDLLSQLSGGESPGPSS
jgi:DNA-binding YbaB/EbfC family protein